MDIEKFMKILLKHQNRPESLELFFGLYEGEAHDQLMKDLSDAGFDYTDRDGWVEEEGDYSEYTYVFKLTASEE